MVKNIIQRIIVGIGIALALMFLKGGLVGNVYALESNFIAPDGMANVQGGNVYVVNMNTSTITGLGTDIYGYSFLNASRDNIYWTFPPLNTFDTTIDIHFLLFVQNGSMSSNKEPWSVFIVDDTHRTFSCNVNQSTWNVLPTGGSTSTNIRSYTDVHCSNIALSNNTRFKLYVAGTFTTSGYVGISGLTGYPHSSNQGVIDSIDNNTQATEDVNNSINNDSTDDPSSDITSMNSKLASNGSITQLLTLPISLYQNILNSVSGACSSFSLGSLFNHNLTLPCINLENLLGSTLYGIIDILISGLFILSFRKKMVDIFNNMTSLKDRGNELE